MKTFKISTILSLLFVTVLPNLNADQTINEEDVPNSSQVCKPLGQVLLEQGINLGKGMKMPKKDYQKSVGKGKCSSSEANKRMMALFHQLEDIRANGDDVDNVFNLYTDMIDARSDLMYTDPSQMCDIIQSFQEAYSLR